jgi:hypothetical protein
MHRFLSALVLVCLFCLAVPAEAQIGIRPAYLEVRLDDGRPTGSFTVTNEADQEVRIRVQALDFSFSAAGGLQAGTPSKYSLAPMIKFNPREFTLPPKASRAVRFSIVPGENLEDGEYWAALGFEPLQANKVTAEQDGRQVSIDVRSGTLVPIYGHIGEIRHSGDLSGVEAVPGEEGIKISATLNNTGTGYLLAEGNYRITDASGQELATGTLGREVVLRDSHHIFSAVCAEITPREGLSVHVDVKVKQLEQTLAADTEVALNDSGE